MVTKVVLPEMGEGVIEGTVSRWLKQEGEAVDQYEPLLEIETDKVTTEATAEEAGTLLKICVPEGETVEVGTILAYIGEPGDQIPENGEVTEAEETAVAPAAEPEPEPEPTPTSKPRAGRYTGRISPVVGRIAAEHDVDLNLVPGTGRDGRITKKDILAYVEQRDKTPEPEPTPKPKPEAKPEPTQPITPSPRHPVTPSPTPGETVPLTNMRRSIAEHMVRSKRTSPHVTTVFEVDFTAVAAHR